MGATLEEHLPFITVDFTQEVVAGSIEIPGLKAGDTLIALNYIGRDDGHALQGHGWFEGIVSADDHFLQRAGTTAPAEFRALFVRLPAKTAAGVEPEAKADPVPDYPDEHHSDGELQ